MKKYIFLILNGVDQEKGYQNVYKYDTILNEYTKINGNCSTYGSVTKIDKMIYLLAKEPSIISPSDSYLNAILKYDAHKNIFYKYAIFDESINAIFNVNNQLYLVRNGNKDLYLLKNKIQDEGDGIYIITNNNVLSKNMSMQSIVDVVKIKNGEEQTVETYVGDGTEWKKLN